MQQETFEFTRKQKERALEIFQDYSLPEVAWKTFYTSWLINIKFSLKKQLKKYDDLNNRYQLLNKVYEKNNNEALTNVRFLNNYMIELTNIVLNINELKQSISEVGYTLLATLKKIQRLDLFSALDISTIFSIPIDLVKKGICKYKNDKNGVVFNLIIVDCGEAEHMRGDLLKIDLQLLPFYWALTMACYSNKFSPLKR